MKKLLLIALMCISISTHAQKKFKQQDDAKHLGWIVTAGGVALTVGAVATPNELSRTSVWCRGCHLTKPHSLKT